ncbi:hypothetical protein ACTXT7_008708 [Hymenolepis weldensis]
MAQHDLGKMKLTNPGVESSNYSGNPPTEIPGLSENSLTTSKSSPLNQSAEDNNGSKNYPFTPLLLSNNIVDPLKILEVTADVAGSDISGISGKETIPDGDNIGSSFNVPPGDPGSVDSCGNMPSTEPSVGGKNNGTTSNDGFIYSTKNPSTEPIPDRSDNVNSESTNNDTSLNSGNPPIKNRSSFGDDNNTGPLQDINSGNKIGNKENKVISGGVNGDNLANPPTNVLMGTRVQTPVMKLCLMLTQVVILEIFQLSPLQLAM